MSGEWFGPYLTLSADYLEASVHDDQGTTRSLADLDFSEGFLRPLIEAGGDDG